MVGLPYRNKHPLQNNPGLLRKIVQKSMSCIKKTLQIGRTGSSSTA